MIHHFFFFSSDDAKAILSIPLSTKLPSDRLVWAYTPRGNFIVRKAYRLAMGSGIGNTFGGASNEENGKIFWKTIWRLNIPNKVKSFAWKASKNILPTKANVIRLVRSGNFLDSHLITMVWSSMSLWTYCGT